MIASSLMATFSLLITTSLAQSSPYSKFINDANSLIAAATGTDAAQLSALYTWQATQTAIPTQDLSSQYQEYLDAYMTTTSAPLPAWVTAIPSSLQLVATSFLQAEASLVVQDIAPIVSQNNEAVSIYSAGQAAPTATSSNTTVAPTSAPSATLSSGFATTGSSNITMSQASGNGTVSFSLATSTAIALITTATGSPTNSVTPPSATLKTSSGAEKPVSVAVAAAVIGILGVVVLF